MRRTGREAEAQALVRKEACLDARVVCVVARLAWKGVCRTLRPRSPCP